jgi:ribokinase
VIVVFGSVNVDLVARVEALPRAGETIAGVSFATSAGGKGANQALAARRAGADVAWFGAVGRDALAGMALKLLRDEGVRLAPAVVAEAPTGVALIHVDASGENAITVVAGANAHAKSADVPDVLLGPTATVLLQLETPESESFALARRARDQGARVVLNPAPARALDAAWLDTIDVLVVNESECAALAAPFDAPAAPERFAAVVARRRHVLACVTLGARGAVAAEGDRLHRAPGLSVQAIDTVGAGDAFTGALAAALDAGRSLPAALARACVAGGLACTREGAQAALPRAVDIERHAAALESRIETSMSPP